MDNNVKELIKSVVTTGTLKDVKNTLENLNLVQDDSFFDYEVLKLALKRSESDIALYLLAEKCCRVKHGDLKEQTPFHLAAMYNHIDCIQAIIEGGASIYDKNDLGRLAIYEAFRQGYMNVCKEILHFCRDLRNLNPKNKGDILHFHIACVLNVVNVVKTYLACGFDVNAPLILDVGENFVFENGTFQGIIDIDSGMTPLHFASENGFPEMVRLLMENGADIDKPDFDGRTPLPEAILKYKSYAKLKYHEKRELFRKVVEILLERKSRLYLEDISFLNEWQNVLKDTIFVDYAHFFKSIYVHNQKLLTLNLHVCENVLDFCDTVHILYNRAESISIDQLSDLDKTEDDCRKELKRMNRVIINDDGTSLSSVLLKNSRELSKYVKNGDFSKIVSNEKLEEQFPLYGYFLKMQYKKGLRYPLIYTGSSLDQSICRSCSA